MSEIPPNVVPPTPPVAPPAQTWFSTLDAEHIGHVQNKGWDQLDPTAAALAMAKAHRKAESYVGIPADQILRLPKAEDSEGWTQFYRKIGAPEKPEGYDFASLEFDDEGLNTRFRGALSEAAAKLNMPKAMAEEFAKALHKTISDVGIAEAATNSAALVVEKAALVESWGPEDGTRFRGNMMTADLAADRLGVTQEVMEKLKDGMGGAAVAELFRKIGAGMGEDRHVRDPGAGNRDVMTREQAITRKSELLGNGMDRNSGDAAFKERYLRGDTAARAEVRALEQLIISMTG